MDRLNKTRAWLMEKWDPCVFVISAPEADSLCRAANGLSLVGLLRPFGVLTQLNGTIGVPVRTVGEAPFRLHSWRLRFYVGNTMFQPAPEAADTYLKSVLTAAAASACDDDVPPVEELLAPGCGDQTPWYGIYRDEFMRTMAFGDHETMDHPVACMLVLPSTIVGDPDIAFKELYARAGVLPPLMQQGVMRSRMPKHYVLLHDASTAPAGTLERAQQLLRQVNSNVVQQCHLLIINTRTREQPAGMDSRFWAAAMPGVIPGGGAGESVESPSPPPGVAYGAGLSERDVQNMAEFVRGLAVNHIIPTLEYQIRELNHQVTSTRKGLRNQLKSLLWRKAGSSSFLSAVGATDSPSASAPSTPTAASAAGSGLSSQQYLHSSVEGEMRALSDMALMLRDHDTALSTLRLLASDFKQDKAWKHYAAVQEALGVATVLAGGNSADAVANFKEAFYRYQQVSQVGGRQRGEGTRYATRTAMLLAEYLCATGQHGEANWVFMKAHFQEENLRAGLLLEQAAYCLLRLTPSPHIRKFAFHLVLAGLRYNLCEQKGLALRAYKQVLGVYSGRRWALIEEHLHDVMGRQSRDAGDWLGAVQHYMSMVLCPANSLYCQRAYLAQFQDVLRMAQGQLGFDPTLELPLPAINLERVGLQYDSQTGYGTPQARQVKGEVWRAMEAAVQPPAEGGPLTWLDGGSRAHMAHQQPEHSCVVGETVGIDVEVSNPLQIELAITRLRLVASFEPAVQHSSTVGMGTTMGAANGPAAADKPKPAVLQIREESVTLGPGERMMVQLRLVPLKAGALTLEGLSWVLNGVALGQQRFRIPRPKPCKLGSSKPLLDAESSPPGGVHFTVLPPLPHLEVSTSTSLPPTLLVGELVRLPLRLRNSGAMTMTNISLAISTPDMLLTVVEAAAPSGATVAAPSSVHVRGVSQGEESGRSSRGSSTPGGRSTPGEGEQEGRLGINSDARVDLALAQQLESLALDPNSLVSGLAGAPSEGAAAQAAAAAPLGLPPKAPRRQSAGGGGGVEVCVSERAGGVTVFSVSPSGCKLGVGQELQLLLWLRPRQKGAVHFNCVWYYEPVVKLDSLKFRMQRFTYSATVQAALQLEAAAVGGRSLPGTCLLQLRALNRQGVEAFRLRQVACPGGAWQLASLQQQAPKLAGGGAHGSTGSGSSGWQDVDVVLGPETAAMLHYHLTPSLAGAPPDSELPPREACGDALSDAVTQWLFLRGHPRRRLPRAPSSASLASSISRHQQQWQPSVADDGESGTAGGGGELSTPVDVLLRWEVAGAAAGEGLQRRTGFHALYQQRVQEGPPVQVQLVGTRRVAHDFTAVPFCTLHLVLRVRNTLPSPATVYIQTGRQVDGTPTPLGMATWVPSADASMQSSSGSSVQPAAPYVWCGRSHITLPKLSSCETVEVPLHVAASQPGSLAISDYVVTWSYADMPALNGSRAGPPCLLVVQQQQLERHQDDRQQFAS